jgi:hypothetical protein
MANIKDEIANLPEPTQDWDDLAIDEQGITVEKLKYFLPKGSRVKVNEQTVELVNRLIDESSVHKGLMEERLMSHLHLLGPGVGLKQLLKGIQFVTLSVTPGMTQSKAWMITFPDKAQEILERDGDPSSFASQYARTKVPQTIMENIQIADSITYAPLNHQIVQKYIELMNGKAADGPASPTVQLNAAMALAEKIKVPEDMTINLNHGVDEDTKNVQKYLADQVGSMATLMRQRMTKGESISSVQKIGIKTESIEDAEVVDR